MQMYVTCCVAPKRIVRIERVKAFVFILLKIVYFRYKKKRIHKCVCTYIQDLLLLLLIILIMRWFNTQSVVVRSLRTLP